MNVVYILSDRHNPEQTGCYGSPIARTPHIDRLAEQGTRFTSAYCHSPICSPTRSAMMTGRYIHEIGIWDNTFVYAGTPRGWSHYFAEQGVQLTTIGKIDFQRNSDFGIEDYRLSTFRENLDITSLFREQEILPRFDSLSKFRANGPAESMDAFAQDAAIAREAVQWLADERPEDRPWILMVNFNDMHRPWNPPQQLWDHYDALIDLDQLDERFFEDFDHLHPFHRTFARHHLGQHLDQEDMRCALVGYHGACQILDQHVGQVLDALEQTGQREETLIVYASDHGGTSGEHRNYDHGAFYDGSIRIPLVFTGPGIQANVVEPSVVSALDILPTLCQAVGREVPDHLRGTSLLPLLRGEEDAPRPDFAFCEYHGAGYNGSVFAICSGQYKYIECVGERPMLFNLQRDPLEMHDLVVEQPNAPEIQSTIRHFRQQLYQICAPETIDARVKADQRARRRELAQSGRLFDEMWKRGYEKNPAHLIHRPNIALEYPSVY